MAVVPSFCPSCGNGLVADARFCDACGYDLSAAIVSLPSDSPAPINRMSGCLEVPPSQYGLASHNVRTSEFNVLRVTHLAGIHPHVETVSEVTNSIR